MKSYSRLYSSISMFTTILVVITSCSFSKDSNKAQNNSPNVLDTITEEQQRQADAGILTEQNVIVQFEEMPNAYFYRMIITWPSSVVKMQLKINDKGDKFILQGNRYEEVVNHDTSFNFQMRSLDQFGSPISSLEVSAKSPMDLVVSENINLQRNLIIDSNRLYFKSGFQIITNGYQVSITTNKMFIEDTRVSAEDKLLPWWATAHILTNTPNLTASSKKELIGSNIVISAKEATGHLHVALIGVNGQNGKSGGELTALQGLNTEAQNTALNGANGSNGESKRYAARCSRNLDIHCEPVNEFCVVAATSGQPGVQGAKGLDGENGWNGGNSGDLVVVIEKPTAFSISVGKRQGTPGKGGAGGKGFVGGIGGQPGSPGGYPCAPASAGANGGRGPDGSSGVDGEQGADASITLGPFPSNIREI